MANHNIAMSLTESPATQSFHTVWFVKARRRRSSQTALNSSRSEIPGTCSGKL